VRKLPLYKSEPEPPIVAGQVLDLNKNCTRCSLHETATNRCLPADGRPGGAFLVGQQPGDLEDKKRRVNVGLSGRTLRSAVDKHWSGPVAYDNATRCFPGKRGQVEGDIDKCRPYLRQTLREVKPTRIITLGSDAVYALYGRTIPIMSARRSYDWLRVDDRLVPVFMIPHPAAGERNPIVKREFMKDIAHVLTCEDPPEPPWFEEFNLVETVEDAEAAVEDLRIEAPWFAYDIEWGGLAYSSYLEVVSFAACSSGSDEAYVWPREAMADARVRAPLLELLEDETVGKVGHNIKGDNNIMRVAYGITVRGTYGDTRLWRRLRLANVDARLKVCAELVGMGGHKSENERELDKARDQIRRARRRNSNQRSLFVEEENNRTISAAVKYREASEDAFAYALVDPAVRDRYCAKDAVSTARLGDLLEGEVEADKSISRIWNRFGRRASDAVAQMEAWGIAADLGAVESLRGMIDLEMDGVMKRLRTYGGFNPESTREVRELLFDDLKLKSVKKTGQGLPSTDSQALRLIRDEHPIVRDMIAYRKVAVLKKNYGNKLGRYIRDDGRIHPDLKLDGTETGRLSCTNPPLHGLPRAETELSRAIKRCFVAPPGKKIVCADYSQIELRIAALLSGDQVMTKMFISGEDFHTATAKLIAKAYWGIDPSAVGKKERQAAKSFNFGLLYGMTDKRLAKELGVTEAAAAKLRHSILGQWKGLASWINKCKAETRRTGYCWTWWDGERARRRPLYGIRSEDGRQRANAENSAVNTPVQGTASDFMLASICDIVEWLIDDMVPAKLVLTVHDSVIFEVDEDALEELVGGVLEIMHSHNSGVVPLKVDVEVGDTYGDLKKYDVAA
jgi:uracil-DNA glycosylase family 4